jgi:hypothetical protein
MGSLLGYVGEARAAQTAPSRSAVRRGGTIRVAMNHYAGSNEPYKLGGVAPWRSRASRASS